MKEKQMQEIKTKIAEEGTKEKKRDRKRGIDGERSGA